MLARIRKAQEENEGGFTLIELLVVMIIIGILAAIAIPVFLSQRAKAQDSAAKSDVSTIGKEIATFYVDNPDNAGLTVSGATGRYVLAAPAIVGPPAVDAVSEDLGKVSNNVVVHASTDVTSSTAWCVAVTNPNGDKAVTGFKYSALGGLEEGTC
jgi:type IV pilus assembly protein PilA